MGSAEPPWLSPCLTRCTIGLQEGCYCTNRWVQKNRKEIEAANPTAKHLIIKYAAELTWSNVTCHVLDQRTLKQKQVSISRLLCLSTLVICAECRAPMQISAGSITLSKMDSTAWPGSHPASGIRSCSRRYLMEAFFCSAAPGRPLPALRQCAAACIQARSALQDSMSQAERPAVAQVLFPSRGNAFPGECLALLGPSGAGKSTLLDILSLRKNSGKITGDVSLPSPVH